MKYTEADTLVTSLVKALEADNLRYSDNPTYAQAYALGYLTSILASIVAYDEAAEQRVRDALRSVQLYTESVK